MAERCIFALPSQRAGEPRAELPRTPCVCPDPAIPRRAALLECPSHKCEVVAYMRSRRMNAKSPHECEAASASPDILIITPSGHVKPVELLHTHWDVMLPGYCPR